MSPEPNRTPVYQQIAGYIREQIVSGALAEGDAVPTLGQIKADWSVSVETARRALASLQADGLVVVRNGVQAVVASQRTVPASAQVAEALGIEEGQSVRIDVVGSSVTFSCVP